MVFPKRHSGWTEEARKKALEARRRKKEAQKAFGFLEAKRKAYEKLGKKT